MQVMCFMSVAPALLVFSAFVVHLAWLAPPQNCWGTGCRPGDIHDRTTPRAQRSREALARRGAAGGAGADLPRIRRGERDPAITLQGGSSRPAEEMSATRLRLRGSIILVQQQVNLLGGLPPVIIHHI